MLPSALNIVRFEWKLMRAHRAVKWYRFQKGILC
jgi:hypothetical protein